MRVMKCSYARVPIYGRSAALDCKDEGLSGATISRIVLVCIDALARLFPARHQMFQIQQMLRLIRLFRPLRLRVKLHPHKKTDLAINAVTDFADELLLGASPGEA